ncbi:MAG TPA: TlpA disulfide reductase family protein [Ferruginibacter sp.]|nr:TlpA disulfide reductase family protein [Ferruginibacter sp.]HRE64767.1 TlpA disulfide reductase family protein [Ferruginibacter sp.]
MKWIFVLLFFVCSLKTFSQIESRIKPVKVDPSTMVVKDSSGTVYAKDIWQKLLVKGRYTLKKTSKENSNEYLLVRLSDEQYEKRKQNMPKPTESKYFKTGDKFFALIARDIDGKKVNTKKMSGQILVINFWFTTCAPCIQEIPELNELTEQYKNDSLVNFIAVGLEDRGKIEDFLLDHPFNYRIVHEGKDIVPLYGIRSYPTHVVVTPEGKVYFHTSGYGPGTVHWIKKSIEELKAKITAEATTVN